MTQKYHPAVTWSLIAILLLALMALTIASPPHNDYDLLFWFLALNVFGLLFLCIILHHEPKEHEREDFIRVFFLLDCVLAVLMASCGIWRR